MKTIVRLKKNEMPKKLEPGILYIQPNGCRYGMCDPVNLENPNPLDHLLEMFEVMTAQ